MDHELLKYAEFYTKRHRRRTGWRKVVQVLGCIVVFCTTYALILPAITEERDAFCGQEAHVHEESCYIRHPDMTRLGLTCSYEALGVHEHDSSCFDEQGHVLCGQADYLIHTHDDLCYDEEDNLICPLPEAEQHTHTDACYEEIGGHHHGEECYQSLRGELLCEEPEDNGHTHGDGCYTEGDLLCDIPENHVHSADCYAESELLCETPENHSHNSDCCEKELQCDVEESAGHAHTDDCYEQLEELTCTQEEFPGEMTLVCTEPDAESHRHDADLCFGEISMRELLCEEPEGDDHTHTDDCYGVLELICPLEEHTHTLICYSDETADVETAEDWEASLSGAELTGETGPDLLAIAETQLGYEESIRNFIIPDDGPIPGYTRYGEWYGDPYADWNDLFALFCIHYADETLLPEDVDLPDWLMRLPDRGADIFRLPDSYHPQPGDLVFMDSNEDGIADRVGIVSELTAMDTEHHTELHVIEGDSEKSVRLVIYDSTDASLLGYVPAEQLALAAIPEPVYICGYAEHTHDETCFNETDERICPLEEHTHDETCVEPVPFCGLAEHVHDETCFDESDQLICTLEEHLHTAICLEENPLFCGLEEHLHEEACYDDTGDLICSITEHEHSLACTVDLTHLSEWERRQVERVILSIDPLPTADEIDAQIMAFEEEEDYEGEEAWLTELYMQVARVYDRYSALPPDLQEDVFNRDKLLELEFIWSVAILIETDVAQTVAYNQSMFNGSSMFVVYAQAGSQYYAFDGYGNAVPVTIDANGIITANVDNKYDLLWRFSSQGGSNYLIRNVSSGRYMHAFPGNGSGVVTTGAYASTLISNGSGVNIRSNSEYARIDVGTGRYVMTQNQSLAAQFRFGIANETTVWLDGSNGGLRSLQGSPTTSYLTQVGGTFTLPETWPSPEKYAYSLRGWYNVKTGDYYRPGEKITVNGEMLLFADWVASTYDIGQFNSYTANTISTNDFITTHVFDFNSLFNALSSAPSVNGGDASWNLVENGTVVSSDEETLNYIFIDYDANGDLSYPNGRNDINTSGDVYAGLYNDRLDNVLFNPNNAFDPETGTGVLGKTHLGTGDHLFQYGADPSDTEHYGYYFYDSKLNAASYNQSDQRFYIYEYLERTADSARDGDSYADFLPLNSPYANTNGKSPAIYTYNGDHGEFPGVNHYQYDTQYNGGTNSTSNIMTNFWFGMTLDLEFYLPNKPGQPDSGGIPANLGSNGKPMVFEFTGDDDVWVLIDNKLALDIGGMHGAESGSINFSTGDVIVNGTVVGNVRNLVPGSHTLTMHYLERGSSKSNFKLRFNISPRYALTLRKEDTLTADLLNGAVFEVYTDRALTQPAHLWPTRDAYERDKDEVNWTNSFEVRNGMATMWGFAAGNTYYLVETESPTGTPVEGVVRMTLNNAGTPDYEVLPDSNPTVGFTAHGYKVSEDQQAAFLSISNTEATQEATEVYVEKKWGDSKDHSGTPVTVYLLANGIRIQEATLNEANDWKHTWVNMPKFDEDGDPVKYTVEEATVPGYLSTVAPYTPGSGGSGGSGSLSGANAFEDGETYLIKLPDGYLSANNGFISLVTDQAAAKTSPNAQWVATVNGKYVILANKAGQFFYYDSSNGSFRASASPPGYVELQYENERIFWSFVHNEYYTEYRYPSTYDTWNGVMYTGGNASDGLIFSLEKMGGNSGSTPPPENPGDGLYYSYRITNTPISPQNTVSLTVHKAWELGNLGQLSDYKTLTVQMTLLADDKDTGLTKPLTFQNGWTATFSSLPKVDKNGKTIQYSVLEEPLSEHWTVQYGDITPVNGSSNAYETTITNRYIAIYELPETGGTGPLLYTIGGLFLVILAGSLLLMQNNEKCKKEGSNSS